MSEKYFNGMTKKELLIEQIQRLSKKNKIVILAIANHAADTRETICFKGEKTVEKKIEYLKNAYTDDLKLKSFEKIEIYALYFADKKEFKFDLKTMF